MKVNNLFFFTLASLFTFQSATPDFIVKAQPSQGRMPASVAAPAKKKIVKKAVVKKAVTSKEMKALQEKLSKLEVALKNKEVLLDQKTKEIELMKNDKTAEKIDALTKLISEQKAEVDKLKNDIQNSEINDINIVNQNKTAVEFIICKSDSKGEKLEADIKKLLDDKEVVLKRIADLTKENEDLKSKVPETPEVKKADIAKGDSKSENPELVTLMSQMTSMFTAQMQSQMQMQVQMMNVLSQMQTNVTPPMNPYSPMLYPNGNYFPQYLTLNDRIGSLGSGLGIAAQASPWSDYSNPYSMTPDLVRQQISVPTGFNFGQAPAFQGFDFNQNAQQIQPQLSYNAPAISL